MDGEVAGDPPCWAHLFGDTGPDRLNSGLWIAVRRIYDEPGPEDGHRVLVDRLWPRGTTKEAARLDEWLRDVAPTSELRRWYGHEQERWLAFEQRYRQELAEVPQLARLLALEGWVRESGLTLLCAARDLTYSNAEVLCRVLLERIPQARRRDSAADPARVTV